MKKPVFATTAGQLLRLLTLAVLLVTGGCKEPIKVDSAWAGGEVEIDGRTGDWAESTVLDFTEQKARIGSSNDSSALYLLLEFDNPQMVRSIAMTGLRLEFRDETDQNKLFTLRYHGGPPPESLRPSFDEAPPGLEAPPPGFVDGPPTDFDGPALEDTKQKRLFTCEIKGRIVEKEIPTDAGEGPRVAFGGGPGRFCYEFSVPLKRGAVRFYGLGVEPGDRLLLTAVWGDRDEIDRGEKRPGGFLGGLTGGAPMGGGGQPDGMPGGGPGRGFGGRNLPEKQEVRLAINLSHGQ